MKRPSDEKNKLREEFLKELTRVKGLVLPARRRGYIFDFDLPLPTVEPTQKRIDFLKSLTESTIYKRAKYINPATGETISGIGGREIEEEARKNKTTPKIEGAKYKGRFKNINNDIAEDAFKSKRGKRVYTEEQKKRLSEIQKKIWANLTDAQTQKRLENLQKARDVRQESLYANEEEKKRLSKILSETQKKIWANLTDAQRQKRLENLQKARDIRQEYLYEEGLYANAEREGIQNEDIYAADIIIRRIIAIISEGINIHADRKNPERIEILGEAKDAYTDLLSGSIEEKNAVAKIVSYYSDALEEFANIMVRASTNDEARDVLMNTISILTVPLGDIGNKIEAMSIDEFEITEEDYEQYKKNLPW